MTYNRTFVRKFVGMVFALLGVVQLTITRRFLLADVFFITVGLLTWFGVFPVTRYFRKKA